MKKFIIGVILGALLTAVIPVAADEITKKVTATVRNDFSIEVDGKKANLERSPLAYDGLSYLPVRELATILGTDVDFKDGVIMLQTKEGETPTSPLPELSPDEQLKRWEEDVFVFNQIILLGKSNLKRLEEEGYEDRIKEVEDSIAANEQKVKELEQKIADLKAKYPELNK